MLLYEEKGRSWQKPKIGDTEVATVTAKNKTVNINTLIIWLSSCLFIVIDPHNKGTLHLVCYHLRCTT